MLKLVRLIIHRLLICSSHAHTLKILKSCRVSSSLVSSCHRMDRQVRRLHEGLIIQANHLARTVSEQSAAAEEALEAYKKLPDNKGETYHGALSIRKPPTRNLLL